MMFACRNARAITKVPLRHLYGLPCASIYMEFKPLPKQSLSAGGFLDYRPGIRNIVDDVSTSAVLVEFANHADIKNLKVGCERAPCMQVITSVCIAEQ